MQLFRSLFLKNGVVSNSGNVDYIQEVGSRYEQAIKEFEEVNSLWIQKANSNPTEIEVILEYLKFVENLEFESGFEHRRFERFERN